MRKAKGSGDLGAEKEICSDILNIVKHGLFLVRGRRRDSILMFPDTDRRNTSLKFHVVAHVFLSA